MLSGDLERLSQHLQSARAMFDSNQSMWGNEPYPRFSEGGGCKPHHGGSYGPGKCQLLGPLKFQSNTSQAEDGCLQVARTLEGHSDPRRRET